MGMQHRIRSIAIIVGVIGAASFAAADTLKAIPSSGVFAIGGNTPVPSETAYGPVGDQITTEFWDNGNGTITFDFQNRAQTSPGINSIITDIYFQDGTWLATSPIGVAGTPGVTWQLGGTPSKLPGGNGVFVTDMALDSSDNQKGIGVVAGINLNPPSDDELQLTFNFKGTSTFTDLKNALNGFDPNHPTAGPLKLGFFVQSINFNGVTGASASFIGTGWTPVTPTFDAGAPLPSSVAGGALLLGCCGLLAVRRQWLSRD